MSETLKAEHQPEWLATLRHPFVAEMASGELPLEKFRFYIEQNLLYLSDYARTIALGAAKSRTDAELQRFAESFGQIVRVEIDENRALLDRVIGLGAAGRADPHEAAPATLAYTSYLLATAFQADPLEIMAVILPCAWTYRDLAAQFPDPVEHPVYREWIQFFSGPEYGAYLSELIDEFDRAATTVDPVGRARLSERFRVGLRLELAFWDQGYQLLRWPDREASVRE